MISFPNMSFWLLCDYVCCFGGGRSGFALVGVWVSSFLSHAVPTPIALEGQNWTIPS